MLTSEQKKERLLGIGGSDVGYIAGLSPYKTPLDIYLLKIGEKEDEDITSESIEVGNDLEQYAAEVYARRKGVEIEKPEKALVHPEYHWMRCNVDFLVKDSTIILECKTTGFLGEEWGEEGTDNIPTPYLLQCAHNAIVSEHIYKTTQVDIPVFSGGHGGLKHRVYTYYRNPELESQIINMERQFWKENIEKRMPPMPVNMKDASILYPSEEDIKKIATEEDMALVQSIQDIRSKVEELEKLKEEKRLELCNNMEGASSLLDTKGKKLAFWIESKRRNLDKKSFKERCPEAYSVYEQFLEETKNKSLRIN